MERYPASATLRDFTEDEHAALVASMKQTGLDPAFPVLVHEGRVLDGGHRYRAAGEASVEPAVMPANLNGANAITYVRDRHDARRHIQHGERALMAAAEVEITRPGRPEKLSSVKVSGVDAARKHHVSTGSVSQAKQVLESGDDALIEAVRTGEKSVSEAAVEVSGKPKRPRPGNASHDNDDEWYTPPWLVDACRAALGGIDLDPASNELANRVVKAERWYVRPAPAPRHRHPCHPRPGKAGVVAAR